MDVFEHVSCNVCPEPLLDSDAKSTFEQVFERFKSNDRAITRCLTKISARSYSGSDILQRMSWALKACNKLEIDLGTLRAQKLFLADTCFDCEMKTSFKVITELKILEKRLYNHIRMVTEIQKRLKKKIVVRIAKRLRSENIHS